MRLEGLYSATIGSFPLDDSERNRARIMDDLLAIGIDYPNYPQLIEMGEQFLRDIDAEIFPPGVEPLQWTIQYLEQKGVRDDVNVKASLTGPFTLAFYVRKANATESRSLYNTMLADKGTVEEYAEILSESCRAYGNAADMIFIDEPILSLIVGNRILLGYTEADIIHIYDRMRNACGDVLVGTHVCGRISPRLARILLRTDLEILSHEFYGTPENFSTYNRSDLDTNEKMLAIGCLSAKDATIERVEEIRAIVKQSTERYGNNLLFTPDDGFGGLIVNASREAGYDIALQKLRNLTTALDEVRSS